jgi:hypothetical protein
MSTDAGQPISQAPRPEWQLPDILDIQMRRIRYQPRRPRNFESALSGYKEAVEFMVQTSGPIPARALGPALFVGDVRVVESEPAGEDRYRFLAFDLERLERGAPIGWGWLDAPESERKRTKFRYQEGR